MKNPKKQNLPKKQQPYNTYLKYSGLATQMLATIGLAVWAGLKLDEKIAIEFPIMIITLPLIALGGTFYSLIKGLNK